MSTHICDAFVVACFDFRFQKYIKKWLEENFQNKTYDYVGFAGSTKNLDIIMNQLDISVRLHHIKEVVLIHHEDCGAYGVDSTHDRHAADLKKARQTINALYPNLTVNLFYLHLDGEFEKVK
jgi:carbonic anhydrase